VTVQARVILSWSGGKDSSLALSALRADPGVEVVGLLTTVTRDYDRISIHGVRRSLLLEQAAAVGLPLWEVSIPAKASNADYEQAFLDGISRVIAAVPDASHVAFGDLFLTEIREYRERLLQRTTLLPLFPLWNLDTSELARRFIAEGYDATLVCVDTTQLDSSFAGRRFNQQFIDDLPDGIDPCGERGEFHTFVQDGPCFAHSIACQTGEIVLRDGRFAYCDILPDNQKTNAPNIP
jgi:uncharacterized protein (TIGR00290 family)